MPFDGNPEEQAIVESEGRQRLRRLARTLRGHIPENFRFDFTHISSKDEANPCGTTGCAIGLYALSHGKNIVRACRRARNPARVVAREFDIPVHVADAIFFDDVNAMQLMHGEWRSGGERYYPVPMDLVTTVMVADAIDRYLAANTGLTKP